MPEVSVVIPSLDEEGTIGKCIEKIKKVFNENHIEGEIFVADNSTDKTPSIAEELGAKVITPDKKGCDVLAAQIYRKPGSCTGFEFPFQNEVFRCA